MCDLFRIKDVDEEYSDLLEVTGVDKVKELRDHVPEYFIAKTEEVNAKKKLVRRVPIKISSVWVGMLKNCYPK